MDEKITTSATENAESTAQAEQAAAPAQSGAQNGTATETVTQSEPQAEQKAEPSGKSGGAESPRESDNSQEENSNQEIAELKGKVHALSVGVAADCIEDVLALAKSKVGGDITLDKAIDSVIEKYPNFKSEKQPPKAIVTSAVATANDEQNTADEARINKIMGIK